MERYKKIAESMDIDTRGLNTKEVKNRLIQSVTKLKEDVGIVKSLGQKGVNSSDLGPLSGKAVKDACIITNPRKATKEDIEVVYSEAM